MSIQIDNRRLSAAELSNVGGGVAPIVLAGAAFGAWMLNGGAQQVYDFTSGVLDGAACARGNEYMCPN